MILTKSKLDTATGINDQILASPQWKGDPAFDSYLLRKDGSQNHTLTLVLKLYFNPLAFLLLPIVPVLDADDKVFWAKPWTQFELAAYKRRVKHVTKRWNDKFWLRPPEGFSKLDVRRGGSVIRPNIYCHLYLDIVEAPAAAHLSIDLANIDVWNFRSHSRLYSKKDPNDMTMSYKDAEGNFRQTRFNTVTHEIGHALGLKHVGETHLNLHCNAAIATDSLIRKYFPSITLKGDFGGGSNSNVCYGDMGPHGQAENVMGQGVQFDATNASPWQQRIAEHTGTSPDRWAVSLGNVKPKKL